MTSVYTRMSREFMTTAFLICLLNPITLLVMSRLICMFAVLFLILDWNKCKRKVKGVPQSQAAAIPRHRKKEETDKTKQEQIEQTFEKQ